MAIVHTYKDGVYRVTFTQGEEEAAAAVGGFRFTCPRCGTELYADLDDFAIRCYYCYASIKIDSPHIDWPFEES